MGGQNPQLIWVKVNWTLLPTYTPLILKKITDKLIIFAL